MIIDLFGEKILTRPLSEVKDAINTLPSSLKEKRAYLLKEFAQIAGIVLTGEDYNDVNA